MGLVSERWGHRSHSLFGPGGVLLVSHVVFIWIVGEEEKEVFGKILRRKVIGIGQKAIAYSKNNDFIISYRLHPNSFLQPGGTCSRTHLPDIQYNHGSRSLPTLIKLCPPLIPLLCSRLHHPSPAEPPHDPRRSLKRAPHQRDASILVDVRDGLTAGARGVEVGCLVWSDNRERRGSKTLRGDVDVGAVQGCGSGEE